MSALRHLEKKGARDVTKLLKNAVDGAKNKDFNQEDLFISESICQEGRKLKRFTVLARGRSTQFKKRMSHLKISLSKVEEKNEGDKSAKKNSTTDKNSKVKKDK